MEELETSPEQQTPVQEELREEPLPPETVSVDELLVPTSQTESCDSAAPLEDVQLRAVLEALIYVAEEPLTMAQISSALRQPAERIRELLEQLVAEFDKPEHGITIREVAGGYKMATKPEHHEAVRAFAKSLKPPLKLSLPALETLAVIAYKQPVTAPEIMEIRGVQGAGVLKTLLDRKLIAAAGRKPVIGKPILYRTTKDFLIQFGLKDLSELPTLKEFEELRRMALADSDAEAAGLAVPAPGESQAPAPENPVAQAPAGSVAGAPDVPGFQTAGDPAAEATADRAAEPSEVQGDPEITPPTSTPED